MIIIIDGPEKAGKSTIIQNLRETYEEMGYEFNVRRWGPVSPDDRVYAFPLSQDAKYDNNRKVTVWDRSWASEHVYAQLLNRQNRRLRDDPWLGEWLYGRTTPNKFMILTEAANLAIRRDYTDLPVNPTVELDNFETYALKFGWTPIWTMPGDAKGDAYSLMMRIVPCDELKRPPAYCGPKDAKVIFVGQSRNLRSRFPGSWLPFSSQYSMGYGRVLGSFALKCGWTNARDIPPQELRSAELVVSCGRTAAIWVDYYVANKSIPKHINIPHPSWLYRWKSAEMLDRIKEVEDQLRQIKAEYDFTEAPEL